ncbi:MAG: outer membrane protein transport protein [Candidatus Eisenbacteria bacterium]|uniref:Outer membrane protein transport protein n=1 Tax=Eiseniibacteriota bacterium TaxID=2212470 RepID=A0A956SCC2_UNCEI|nr:outer membrane protein transport protein [Candidatus Eisenbacteria bacterium]
MKLSSSFLLTGLAAVIGVTPAFATNGMNMIAYDAVSAGMGGADAAMEAGCTSVAANPANLTTLCSASVAANLSLLSPSISFMNDTQSGHNDIEGESQYFPLPFIGYASRLRDSNLAWGIGLFAQGGMGVDIKDAMTNFGTQDRIYSNVRYMRLAPTLAYDVSDKLALGATVYAGYSDVAYEFFPKTSYYNPGPDQIPQTADDIAFPGQKLDGARSFGAALRAGIRYEVTPTVALGGSFTTKSTLDFKDGDLDMNMEQMGAGMVRYEGSMDGFTWPASAEGGVAVKLLENTLTVAADVQWIQWSSALETVTVKGTNPNVAGMPDVEIPFVFNWDDQMVYALGASYSFSERDVVRAGFNFAANPIPDEYVYPLFPATTESHVTFGYGRSFNRTLVDFAVEHAFDASVTNPNTDPMVNPFGPGDEISHSQTTFHIAFTYKIAE